METTTLSAATKTIERAFGGNAINFALVIMTREVCGCNHPATTLTSYAGHIQGSFGG